MPILPRDGMGIHPCKPSLARRNKYVLYSNYQIEIYRKVPEMPLYIPLMLAGGFTAYVALMNEPKFRSLLRIWHTAEKFKPLTATIKSNQESNESSNKDVKPKVPEHHMCMAGDNCIYKHFEKK